MNMLRVFYRNIYLNVKLNKEISSSSSEDEMLLPQYRKEETDEVKRARLFYQSRQRGILENCLLLSTFAYDHLRTIDGKLLKQYDELINIPNEWEIYYWVTGARQVPDRFNNEILSLLKSHVRRNEKRLRKSQPIALPE